MYTLSFVVRDNEVDMQGIVNNANYFIYLAHTRHQYLKSIGISFAKMSQDNQNLVLISSQIQFKQPLRAEDPFRVTCQLVPEGRIRLGFQQDIYRCDDSNTHIVTSYNVGVCLDGNNRNRPYVPEPIQSIICR